MALDGNLRDRPAENDARIADEHVKPAPFGPYRLSGFRDRSGRRDVESFKERSGKARANPLEPLGRNVG